MKASEYYQQGLEKFKKIVEQAPDSLQALHGLSNLYNKLGGSPYSMEDRV